MNKIFKQSDVVLNAIDIAGITVDGDPGRPRGSNVSNDGLHLLADATGGTVFENSNDLHGNFERMMREQEVVYVLAFQAERELVWIVTAKPWQPTLIYPARGVGMLWDPTRPAPPDALAKLIGRSRATLLMALDCPRSTTELAGALGVSSGGISQQLAILGDAGLVSRRRVQRFVLYLRSADGDALVEAATRAA